MPARAVTRIEDLAVLERERSGVVVGAQDPVRRAVADDGVADGDVMGFAEHAGQRPAPDVEAIEDHMVGLLELDGVRAARRTGRVEPTERFQRNVTGLPGAPRSPLRTMMSPL